jgi:hypothetical protein
MLHNGKCSFRGLPNISFILRKPEPLGERFVVIWFFIIVFLFLTNSISEMKCTACSSTGCMLNLEIQRGKEGMKTMKHNNCIGATSGCTLRVMEDKVGENHHFNGIIVDAWFGLTQTVTELSKAGFEGIFQIKQYAALFPKKYIEKLLKMLLVEFQLFYCASTLIVKN